MIAFKKAIAWCARALLWSIGARYRIVCEHSRRNSHWRAEYATKIPVAKSVKHPRPRA